MRKRFSWIGIFLAILFILSMIFLFRGCYYENLAKQLKNNKIIIK